MNQPTLSGRMKTSKLTRTCLFVIVSLLLCNILTGCAPQTKQEPANALPIEEVRLHKVNFPNENLSMIALWYTGDAKKWPLLRTYNGQLASASNLSVGNTIRIPAAIMTRIDQMPLEFVAEQRAKYKRGKKKSSIVSPSKKISKDPFSLNPTPQLEAPPQEEELISEDPYFEESSQDQLIENLLPEQ